MLNKNEKILTLYESGHSISKLEKEFNKSFKIIKNILVENGVKIRSAEESRRISRTRSVVISRTLMSKIEGEILGDASIGNSKYQSFIRFASAKKDYIDWLVNIFINENIPVSKIDKIVQFDYRTNKEYTRYCFRTKCSLEFRKLREKWYNACGKKIIPNDLSISSNLLLHWWLGDGTVGTRCGFLCTDCFEYNEVESLSQKINYEYGLNTKTIYRKNPNGNMVPRIYIPKKSLLKLFEIIGAPPIQSLSHRWRVG